MVEVVCRFHQVPEARQNGWLDFTFPDLDLTLHMRFLDCGKFKPLTYIWKDGVQASKFKVKFREPVPII